MIDKNAKLLNSDEESLRIAMEGRLMSVWTSVPGIIQSVNFQELTCVVQPSITEIVVNQRGEPTPIRLPLLLDVPIVFPSGGGFIITFPLVEGDEVLVSFSARCIDAWQYNGGIQQAAEARMHDLSDAFAIPGPKSLPKTVGMGNINSSELQIRSMDGDTVFSVGTKFTMQNDAADLKHALGDLTNALISFAETLAGFSGGGAPVTQAMLQVPGETLDTAISDVHDQLNALLGDLD